MNVLYKYYMMIWNIYFLYTTVNAAKRGREFASLAVERAIVGALADKANALLGIVRALVYKANALLSIVGALAHKANALLSIVVALVHKANALLSIFVVLVDKANALLDVVASYDSQTKYLYTLNTINH